jgi:thiol-disulfide isomerase/thioredoxin
VTGPVAQYNECVANQLPTARNFKTLAFRATNFPSVFSNLKQLIDQCARCLRPALFGALILCVLIGCGNNDSDKHASSNFSERETPRGSLPPRTSLPMPPIKSMSGDRNASYEQGFTLFDNRRMRLTDYLGDVVIVDFWATYCPPCLEEVPHLAELQRRYEAQGLHVIGLHVGGEADRAQIPGFVKRFKVQYELGYPDPEMVNFYMAEDDRIPQTFVFDRAGRLVKHFVGYDDETRAQLERIVQDTISEKAD